MEARVAGGLAAAGQAGVQGQVVDVAVGGGASVSDGVGEAVGAGGGVLEARGRIEGLVGDQASVSCEDGGVLRRIVGTAVCSGGEVVGEGLH